MAMPLLWAIAASRSRNCAVGIDATVRRNFLPRRPRPIFSRPTQRASRKFKFSMLTDPQLTAAAMRSSFVMACRRLAQLRPVLPAESYVMVIGSPYGVAVTGDDPCRDVVCVEVHGQGVQ